MMMARIMTLWKNACLNINSITVIIILQLMMILLQISQFYILRTMSLVHLLNLVLIQLMQPTNFGIDHHTENPGNNNVSNNGLDGQIRYIGTTKTYSESGNNYAWHMAEFRWAVPSWALEDYEKLALLLHIDFEDYQGVEIVVIDLILTLYITVALAKNLSQYLAMVMTLTVKVQSGKLNILIIGNHS